MKIFTKIVLVLVALGIASSLILSDACTGAIDSIFIGWRDLTKCPALGTAGQVFSREHLKDGGAYILLLLLIILIVIIYLYKVFISNKKI